MSFLASVPHGTQLYHDTHQREPVTGVDWLAFGPEHAALFARPWRGRPRRLPGEVMAMAMAMAPR